MRYLEAFVALVVADLLRVTCGPAVWSAALRLATRSPDRCGDCAEIPDAVDRASRWFLRRIQCVQRSLAIALMCRARGRPARVVLGARPRPFAAHAWVELDEALLGEDPSKTRFYRVFEKLG